MHTLKLLQYSCLVLLGIAFTESLVAQMYYLFVGTYTSGTSKGIYVYTFDSNSGKVYPSDTLKIENPSYLALTKDGRYLYAVSENGGSKPGMIHAYSFDKNTGKLHFLNSKESKGDFPCYIAVSNNNKWV